MSLTEIELAIERLKAALRPWRGMTLDNARAHGWTEKQDAQQARLWSLGYQLTACRQERIRQERTTCTL